MKPKNPYLHHPVLVDECEVAKAIRFDQNISDEMNEVAEDLDWEPLQLTP